MLTLPSKVAKDFKTTSHYKHRHAPSLSPISSFAFPPRPWVFPSPSLQRSQRSRGAGTAARLTAARGPSAGAASPSAPARDFQTPRPPPSPQAPGGQRGVPAAGGAGPRLYNQGKGTLPLLPPALPARRPRHGAGCLAPRRYQTGTEGPGSPRRRGGELSAALAAQSPARGPTAQPARLGGGIRAALWAEGYGEEPAARSAGALSPVAG